ncbi:MAG: sigma-54-dependent Fis family transcriptional regulator [Planctomycetes bacterium]|nr:sigma-54-dependent Fis family transcriptional regulator [Planctomycetota bacterium]
MISKILLADDETIFRKTFAKVLQEEGMAVTTVDNGTDAIDAITKQSYAVVILDIQMPGADGIKVLREIMRTRPQTRVIMITAYGSIEMAVEAIKLGACDYVMKPVVFEDILAKIRQHLRYLELQEENQELKRELDGKFDIGQIIGRTEVMQQVFEMIRKVANTKSNVLITGRSGTGKELVARAIHSLGSQNGRRFVVVNCGAIPEGLLESELFGHKKGSFTSATENKKGLFEVAHNGTLFLDEIGYMPMSCQVKLLRAVEQRQIMPVGSTEPVDVDLRLIAATNRDLLREIKEERFREDLYYRLNVVGIRLPTLQERKDDIPLLIEHFIKKYNAEMGKHCVEISDDAMRLLMGCEWKGNIRELENVIERAVIFAEGDVIEACDIGLIGVSGAALSGKNENLRASLKAYEKEQIYRVLNKYDWNKGEAAKALGVGLSSLYRKIDELEMNVRKHKRE